MLQIKKKKVLEEVRVFKSLIFNKKKKVNLLLVLIFKQFRGRTKLMKLLNKIFGNDTFLLDNASVVWKRCNCPYRAGLFSEKHTCNRIFCRME